MLLEKAQEKAKEKAKEKAPPAPVHYPGEMHQEKCKEKGAYK